MNIQINNHRRNPELEDHIRSLLTSGVGRCSQRIERIEVHFRDESPGNDGAQKTCSIDIKIHVSGKDKNIYAAATDAARRAERSILKNVGRQRTRRHTNATPQLQEPPVSHERSMT